MSAPALDEVDPPCAPIDLYDLELIFSCFNFFVRRLVLHKSKVHKKSYKEKAIVELDEVILPTIKISFEVQVAYFKFDSLRQRK